MTNTEPEPQCMLSRRPVNINKNSELRTSEILEAGTFAIIQGLLGLLQVSAEILHRPPR